MHTLTAYETQLTALRKERDELLTQFTELSEEVERLKSVMDNSESSLNETEKERQQLLVGLGERRNKKLD